MKGKLQHKISCKYYGFATFIMMCDFTAHFCCSHNELESSNTGNTDDRLGVEDISQWYKIIHIKITKYVNINSPIQHQLVSQ